MRSIEILRYFRHLYLTLPKNRLGKWVKGLFQAKSKFGVAREPKEELGTLFISPKIINSN